MLKEYYDPVDTQPPSKAVITVKSVGKSQAPSSSGRGEADYTNQCEPRLMNSDILKNLEEKFHHLSLDERKDMIQLVYDLSRFSLMCRV